MEKNWFRRIMSRKVTEKQCVIHVVMHWVVCKEELPKKEGNYLINWDGVVLEAEFYKEDKIWISEEGMLYENVTHWMHLPKPPCA
jgi:hypothetical protein